MARETKEAKRKRAIESLARLRADFPNAVTALAHRNPFELLIATILSAQCTDERVNKVTPALFDAGPTPAAMHALGQARIEMLIKSVNFFRNKARNVHLCCNRLKEHFNSEVPTQLDDLVSLPGVGRKTANVVLGNAFGKPSMVVDTHVMRLGNRLAWVSGLDPIDLEQQFMKVIPEKDWVETSHLLILHGRATCKALNPQCAKCTIADLCPSRFKKASFWNPSKKGVRK